MFGLSIFYVTSYEQSFSQMADKTTLKYVLNSNGCEDIMPEYYVYVENEAMWWAFYLFDELS